MNRASGYILPWIAWLFLFSCTIHEKTFDNPVDYKGNQELGIGAPTLVFYPKTQSRSISDSVKVESFLIFHPDSFESFAGVHLQMNFPNSFLELDTIKPGIFITDTNKTTPLFVYNYDGNNTIDIFAYFLDTAAKNLTGSGHLADIILNPLGAGTDSVLYNLSECAVIDHEDNTVQVNGERGTEVIVQ